MPSRFARANDSLLVCWAVTSSEIGAIARASKRGFVDQRAYQLNKQGNHARALAMYAALPDADVHPFASYRRDAGRAWGQFRAGNTERAIELAHRACEHAGDGGYTRLRAMGLILLAKIGAPGDYLARARAIAVRLDDRELLARATLAVRR